MAERWTKSIRNAALGSLMLCAGSLLSACGSKAPAGGSVTVDVSHVFDSAPLRLDGTRYTTAAGEQIDVSRLRYYLSLPRLKTADGQWFAYGEGAQDARAYFLVDASETASQRFTLDGVKPGEYQGIELLIGVDDARNHAGAQTGTLDPARGMFWSWNTGYVFFKLEGHSPQSPDGNVVIHVGGGEPSNARRVYLPFGEDRLRVKPELISTVHLQADIATLFAGATPLRLAANANIMEPSQGAPIADRYAGLLRVDHLHHEPRH